MTKLSPSLLLATFFGAGYLPAPGTAGSAAAILVAVLAGPPPVLLLIAAAALTGPGVWAAGRTARAQGLEDPQIVVVDEVLGQWIALGAAVSLSWQSCLAAFLLFRLFDIWKPFPIRRLEKLPGGWGIVADDLLAGVYAAACVRLLILWRVI